MRVYRASSLGYSLEALVAPHLGYLPVDPPEFLQKAYDEGHRIEPLAIEKLRTLGWNIQTTQPIGEDQIEVELEIIPGVAKVVGHLDGITKGYVTRWTGEHRPDSVLEIKSMAHRAYLAFKRSGWALDLPLIEKYKWQASAYMLATGLPHVMVAWDKETEELHWETMDEPFNTISDIARKLAVAEDYIERGVVPDGCDDYPCSFYYLHPPKDEVAKVKDDHLELYLNDWLIYDRAEKAAKKAKDEVRASILALTGDALAAKVKGECGVTVETYWQEGTTYTTTRKAGWITRISGPRGQS